MKKVSMVFEFTVNNKFENKLKNSLKKECSSELQELKGVLEESCNGKIKTANFKITTENI